MTQVLVRLSNLARTAAMALAAACLLGAAPIPAGAQAAPPPPAESRAESQSLNAAALYRRLGSTRLDPQRVYLVREGRLNREDVRITLLDGAIAFLEEVDGRVTGAFFEGEGEVLIIPPDRAERDHLGLFTGASILQEKFSSAFFRFNDDVLRQLQPALRRPLPGAEFVARHAETVAAIAPGDALRLLRTLLNAGPGREPAPGDRMLRARVAGVRLGVFDVYFDTTLREQVWAAQASSSQGRIYYDRWLSFPMRSQRQATAAVHPRAGALQPGESELARVSHYRIRAQVRPPEELDAEAELTFAMQAPGQRVLTFELSRYLKVRSVELDGQAVEFIQNEAVEGSELARRGNDLVAVVFPHALPVGVSQRLRFHYRGAVMSDAGGGLLYVGARGIWYPNLGMALADFDLEFRHPAPWTVVATGERAAERPEDEWTVSRWVTRRPIPLAGFNLGRYQRAVAHAGEVRVETYAASAVEDALRLPSRAVVVPRPTVRNPMGGALAIEPPPAQQPAAHAQAVADNAARSVEFLAQRLGPFPYESLSLAQMPGRLSQGWPTLVFLSSYVFLTPEEKDALRLTPFERALYGRLVQAHETAHQWWGDAVLWDNYRDQWLLEALANYSALLQVEAEDPAAFSLILEQYRSELLRPGAAGRPMLEAGPVTLGLRLASSRFPDGYDVISYGRGTWLMHMLRHMLRDAQRPAGALPEAQPASPDEPFLRALRRVRAQYEDRALSTDAFRRVLEEELPPALHFEGEASLDWFFEEWVAGIAVPALELKGVRLREENGRPYAEGRILQKHAPETFVTSVPLWAETADGRRFLGRVFAEGEESTFRIDLPPGAQRLLLDPEKTLLTR